MSIIATRWLTPICGADKADASSEYKVSSISNNKRFKFSSKVVIFFAFLDKTGWVDGTNFFIAT